MAHFNFTEDGDTDWVRVNGPTWIHIDYNANFDGGTLALTFQGETGNEQILMNSDGTPVSYAAGADDFFDFPAPVGIKLTLTGSTAPEDLYVQIQSNRR